MFTFRVTDVTCGHCAGKIARAIAEADAGARVTVDIPGRLVTVASAAAADELLDAIREAGYSPEHVAAAPEQRPPRASGCGCGCGPRSPALVDMPQSRRAAAPTCCG